MHTETLPKRRPRRLLFVPALGAAIGVIWLLGMSLLTIVVAWNFAGANERARTSITLTDLVSLRARIAKFNAASSTYPATLNQLVPTYATTIPLDGWGRSFIYTPTPGGPQPFDLRSAGPDGIAGTKDDI